MNKLKFTMMTLILVMMAMAFMACNKEKEYNVQNEYSRNTHKSPIATFDRKNGSMVCHYLPEDLQRQMGLEFKCAKDDDRYVISSLEIVDSLSYTNFPVLNFVILDTENETSNSVFLLDVFVISEDTGDYIQYYLSEDVINGQYVFGANSEENGTRYLLTVENGELIVSELAATEELQPGTGFSFTCTGVNCIKSCDPDPNELDCTRCVPDTTPGLGPASCTKSSTISLLTYIVHLLGVMS